MTPPELPDTNTTLWSGRPGFWRSLTLMDVAGWVGGIAAIGFAVSLYLDHARMVTAYGDTAFGDMPMMRNRNLGLMIVSFLGGLLAIISSIAAAWRITGTQYTLTPTRLTIASRSLTGVFTVTAPLRRDGPTVTGRGLFGHLVAIPAGDVIGTVDIIGLTEQQATDVLARYEGVRRMLPAVDPDRWAEE